MIRILLIPFLPGLWLYRFIVSIRNFCYDRGIFSSIKLPALVISVGNLSAGGTGKTPLTILLAKILREQGWNVVIVARGYRRQKKGLVIVSDGRQILADIAEAGDEPLLLAQACAGIPVVVDEQKKVAAAAAVKKFSPDIILVDDGFQHRQLQRDLDVVLLDARMPLNNLWWLPAAPQREPASSLRRANFLILNTGSPKPAPALAARCRQFTAAKIFSGALEALGWRELANPASKLLPLAFVKDQPAVLVSGIAHPERFREMAEKLGARLVSALQFRDHYAYQENDIAAIESTRKARGARYILTTSKDAGKLAARREAATAPFLILETAFKLETAFLPIFLAAVRAKMRPSKAAAAS